MLRRVIAIAALALGMLLATAAPAAAKGPSHAWISGPGLAKPIALTVGGEPGQGTVLSLMSEQCGFFDLLFGPNNLSGGPQPLRSAPPGTLGPRYVITYAVSGLPPAGELHATVRQHVYPYATGGPAIFTPPGQRAYDQTMRDGWMRAKPALLQTLTRAGVPRAKPVAVAKHAPADLPSAPWIFVAAAAALAIVPATLWLRRRSLRQNR